MDLSQMREEYKSGRLDREDLESLPLNQFKKWIGQAESAGLPEANAMTLATVDKTGQPFTRTVLLKRLDDKGLVFFTNFESRKAEQIAENPHVSLLFTWLPLERQVSVNGIAERISSAESLSYFLSRPLASRLGAWASRQSEVIKSRALLEEKFAEMSRKFADGKIPLPSFWGGYRVSPITWEFWQGRQSRLHDRFLYRKHESKWTVDRLSP